MQVLQYLFLHSSSIHDIFSITWTQKLNSFHTYTTFCIQNWQLTRRHPSQPQVQPQAAPTFCPQFNVHASMHRRCWHILNMFDSYTAWQSYNQTIGHIHRYATLRVVLNEADSPGTSCILVPFLASNAKTLFKQLNFSTFKCATKWLFWPCSLVCHLIQQPTFLTIVLKHGSFQSSFPAFHTCCCVLVFHHIQQMTVACLHGSK